MAGKKIILVCVFVLTASCFAAMSELEKKQLFDKANESFSLANSIVDDKQQQQQAYNGAILAYEKLIADGPVRNAKLYYNLGNAYFLKGDLGQAIMNYKRALNLDDSDMNVKKNLAFARSRKVDSFEAATSDKVLTTIFFWHYDFSLKSRFVVVVISAGVLFLLISVVVWRGFKIGLVVPALVVLLAALLFGGSVVVERVNEQAQPEGVITAKSVIARQGDGVTYPESFKQPLHEGTEFELLEHRTGWYHIQLPDGSDGWINDNSAELI